jgi:hypothetical protein
MNDEPCKTTLHTIKLIYDGAKLAAMLEAWEKHPTYKTDCQIEKAKKEAKRKQYAERRLNLQV